MLTIGELAPDFEGPTSTGATFRLSSLRGHRVVLYFYPKASSYGCTHESIEFAHAYPDLRSHGAEVVGISVDNEAAQRQFAEECELPFTLVADSTKEIARKYGVLGAFGLAKRVTFLLDPDGRVTHVTSGTLPGPHIKEVRAELGISETTPAHSRSK
jgi:thioredoxin-dependent peroxiredoxin